MVRISLLFTALILSILIFQSCEKKKSDCAFIAPDLVYVGFNESETDTLIVRRYAKGTGFGTLLDTFRATKVNIDRTVIGQDSVILYPTGYTKLDGEFYANDWEVVLPGANRVDRFSDVQPRFAKETEASGHCQSFVETMNANGMMQNYSTWFGLGYRYYINR